MVGVAVRGGGGEGVRWGRSVMSLLRLCIRCQPLIDIAAEECLNICEQYVLEIFSLLIFFPCLLYSDC